MIIKEKARKTISSLILASFLALQVLPYLPTSVQNIPLIYTLKKASLFNPGEVEAAGISSMSATLSNPRLSFHGLANAEITSGDVIGVVKGSGAGGDWDTKNLFPLDSLIITGNAAILIASVSSNLNTFMLKSALVTTAAADSNMTVAQGGTLKVQIFTAADIPALGSIKVSIPSSLTGPTDGIPLAESSLVSSGFDSNGMTNANTACPGGFSLGTFTAGSGGTPHTFTCNNGAAAILAGTPLTITIGDNTKPLINPAPISTGHTRGVADIYSIAAETYTSTNGSGTLLAGGRMKVAPVEGVLVTASVDETLSFTVAGLSAGTYCGAASNVATTATSVPWGTLNSTYSEGSNNAAQLLTVSTNASSGYAVYAEENDQMGREGNVCTGLTPSGEPYTYSGSLCIRDYNKGSATHTTSSDWTATPGTDYGFGYSLESVQGSVRFNYGGGAAWNAKHFADQEGGNDKYATNADLMYASSPAEADSARVCYRIHIPGVQPAGYYYNKLKFTAVAKF